MANGITTKQTYENLIDQIKEFKNEIKSDIKDLFKMTNETDKTATANEKGLGIITKLVIGLTIAGVGSMITAIITLIIVVITNKGG